MKKSAIALAVATAMGTAAANAETILYGSARVSVDFADIDTQEIRETPLEDFFDVFKRGTWDIVDNSSRLGVRGSEDLGNGLSAIYQFEFAVNVTDGVGGGTIGGNRPKLVGLKHDQWGTLSVGTQWTPYYNVTGVTDVFNSTPHSFVANLGPFRKNSTIVYLSPDFMGLTFEGMLQLAGEGTGSRDVDSWDANIRYQMGPLFAGVAYTSVESGVTDLTGSSLGRSGIFDGGGRDQWALGLGYSIMDFSLGLTAEYGNFSEIGDSVEVELVDPATGAIITDPATGAPVTQPLRGRDALSIYGVGAYAFGPNIVRLGVGWVEPEGSVLDERWIWAAGYQHNLSTRTRLWVEYHGQRQSSPQFATDPRQVGDSDAVSVGVRHDF